MIRSFKKKKAESSLAYCIRSINLNKAGMIANKFLDLFVFRFKLFIKSFFLFSNSIISLYCKIFLFSNFWFINFLFLFSNSIISLYFNPKNKW